MSATVSYIKPQMRLFHEVEEQYSGLVGALQAVIIGPHYDVKKYVDGALDNNYELYAGDYTPGQDNVFSWPNRAAGGLVDLENVVVHVDGAMARYWDGASSAATTRLLDGTRTHIRSSSINWATYNQFPRSTLLPKRDVAIGDGVRIRIPAASVDMYSRVTGFAHDLINSSIGAVVPDSNNKATSAAEAEGSLYFSTGTPPTIQVDGSGYTGTADGILNEVFTITVTQDAVGGDNDTAKLLITSDGGINVVDASTTSGAISASDVRGLDISFDADGTFAIGQTWRVVATGSFTVPSITLSGDYTAGMDTTYVIRVLSGGVVGSATRAPILSVDTTNGVDYERVDKTLSDTDFLIGNYGLEASVPAGTTFAAGDQYTIDCVAQQNGAISTLIIADSLPDTVTDTMAVQVDLYLRKNIVIDSIKKGQAPYLNYVADLRNITLSPEVTYFEESMVDNTGNEVRMILEAGRVYVEYRGLLQTYSNSTHELLPGGSDMTTILDNIKSAFGYYGPENPIAMGCYFASLNAGGTAVLYVAVKSDDLEGYATAMGKLDARSGTYGVVPLTQDPEILSYIQAQINVAASPENCRWRKGWFTEKFSDLRGIVTAMDDGTATLAKVTSRVEDDGKFLTVEMEHGKFITNEVRPGDVFRFNYRSDGYDGFTYESYVVDHVLSEDSLKLVDGPDRGYDIAMKAEIWRTLLPSETAKAYAQRAGSYHDKRINLIWPPEVPVNGETVPGYYLCAALAGIRSGVLPHQGLTNVEVRGFDAMPLTTDYLIESDLNVMAASGVWIVTSDMDTGEIFTRHQLTTAGYDDIKRREDSVISNWDSISYRLRNLYRKYIGTSNLTKAFVAYFRTLVDADLRNIRNETTGTDILRGPQIETYEIVEFKIHDTLPDALVCRVRFTGPHPFNNFDMYMIF